MKKKILVSFSIIASLVIAGFILQSSFPKSKPVYRTNEKNSIEELQALQKLGFKQSRNLRLGESFDARVHPDLVKFYQEKYNVLYFSNEGIQQYCSEHNLVLGASKDFIGSIPSGNIKEMNTAIERVTPKNDYSLYYITHHLEPGIPIVYISESNIRSDCKTLLRDDGYGSIGAVAWIGSCAISDIYSPKYGANLILHKDVHKGVIDHSLPIMVAAPQEEFDLKNKEIIDGIIRDKKIDPMVLAVVPDGYVLLTRWYE